MAKKGVSSWQSFSGCAQKYATFCYCCTQGANAARKKYQISEAKSTAKTPRRKQKLRMKRRREGRAGREVWQAEKRKRKMQRRRL